jgi:molybdate transport system substrate-binding protein
LRRRPTGAARDSLTVLAASSLTDAFLDAGGSCCDSAGVLPPRFGFSGSQAIRARLERGEPADVVAMADSIHIRALWRAGKVGLPRRFAHGRLAIVAAAHDSSLFSYVSLTQPGLKIASAAPDVPLARYTEILLMRIEGLRRDGRRLTESIRLNLTKDQPSARAVLESVMRGQAQAGIVYATDLEAAHGRLRTLQLPDFFSPQVEYFIAPVTASPHSDEAGRFVEFVTGESGQQVLRRHGFEP